MQGRAAVVAVNNAFQLAPWADVLYAADASWWYAHAQQALAFEGLKVTADPTLTYREVRKVKQTGTEGYDPTPGNVRTGNNSGYQAVHVAIQAGAKRILLVGFDMKGSHFFGAHKYPLRNPNADSFGRWIRRFPALNGHGAEIINCTPDSALRGFPVMPLNEALQ